MTNKFNQHFPNVVVLGTTDDTYRDSLINQRLSKHNIDYETYRASKLPFYKYLFERVKISHHWSDPNIKYLKHSDELAITVGHLNIIRMAKDRGWKSVFIFENDTTVNKDFNDIVDKYLDTIPDDWDMLYFSITVSNENQKQIINDNWFKPISHCTLASAYVIKDSLYDEILNFYEQSYFVIDLYYALFLQRNPKFNIYSTTLNLFAQSRATDVHTDYNQLDVFDLSINFGNYTIEDYE